MPRRANRRRGLTVGMPLSLVRLDRASHTRGNAIPFSLGRRFNNVVPSVAVVGATGAVGEIMRQVLQERSFPLRAVKFLASERSAGKTIEFKGKSYAVELM